MKRILLAAFASFALAISGHAAAITISAINYNGFSDQTGADLAVGNQVRVGTFALTNSQIQAYFNVGNFAALDAGWISFGAAHIGDNIGSAGFFQSSQITASSNTLGLAGAQVYLWVFKTATNIDPNGSYSNVTGTGIYYLAKDSAATYASKWSFRADGAIPNSTTVDISDLTSGNNSNTIGTGANIVVGSFPGSNSVTNPGAKNFNLATVVPEPSSAVLLMGGLAALAGYRRRRA